MIPVSQALDELFNLVSPLDIEHVALRDANNRVLAQTQYATRTQPPFAASSMDGYAVKGAEVEDDCMFKVIGESAAGHGWDGTVGAGQAVRIFTGAPVPKGADFVVIQEDVKVQHPPSRCGFPKRGSDDGPSHTTACRHCATGIHEYRRGSCLSPSHRCVDIDWG
jgi:molybdopterin biosynthesis enzyme